KAVLPLFDPRGRRIHHGNAVFHVLSGDEELPVARQVRIADPAEAHVRDAEPAILLAMRIPSVDGAEEKGRHARSRIDAKIFLDREAIENPLDRARAGPRQVGTTGAHARDPGALPVAEETFELLELFGRLERPVLLRSQPGEEGRPWKKSRDQRKRRARESLEWTHGPTFSRSVFDDALTHRTGEGFRFARGASASSPRRSTIPRMRVEKKRDPTSRPAANGCPRSGSLSRRRDGT